MSYDQFCHNCGLDFQHLSAEEEARYSRDPGYCPNCAYPLAGRYPPPAPPIWSAQDSTMPPRRSVRRRNILITIAALLLVVIGLFVLISPWSPLGLGLIGQHPAAIATMANTDSLNSATTMTAVSDATTVAVTQTAVAGGGNGDGSGGSGGSGSGGGGSGGGGGSSPPTATPIGSGGGGGANPTTTPVPPPVVVTISPTTISVQCGDTTTIVMTNPSSTQTASWTAHAVSLPAYTLTPSSGTIPPHGTQKMVVSNISKLLPLGTIIVTSGGLPQTVTITCTIL